MIEITFLGRGGQGAFTSSRILGVAVSLYEKKHSLSFPSFGPERRGAPVFAYTKISDKPIRDRSQSIKSDYIVLLDESLYTDAFVLKLKDKGKIILNSENPEKYIQKGIIAVNATHLATQYLGRPIVNTAMLAALVAQSQLTSIESLKKAISYDLPPKLAEKNIALIEHIETVLGGNAHV